MKTTTELTICPFEVHVPEEDLADLRRRIEAWRPPELRAAFRTLRRRKRQKHDPTGAPRRLAVLVGQRGATGWDGGLAQKHKNPAAAGSCEPAGPRHGQPRRVSDGMRAQDIRRRIGADYG